MKDSGFQEARGFLAEPEANEQQQDKLAWLIGMEIDIPQGGKTQF